MQGMLCRAHLAETVFGLIPPIDATRFAVSCRQAAEGALMFRGAICFALSRPGVTCRADAGSGPSRPHANDHLLDMNWWKSLWESCAQSVAAAGLDPSALAFSERVSCTSHRDGGGDWTVSYRGKFIGSDFLSCLLKLAQAQMFSAVQLIQQPCETANPFVHGDIAAVLMADLDWERDDSDLFNEVCTDSGFSLVGLSDGWFSLICWKAYYVGEAEIFAGAAVYIDRTIPSLFELVSATSGETCGWILADDGTLTLSSAAAVDSLPCAICHAWRNLPCSRSHDDAHGRNVVESDGRPSQVAKTLGASWSKADVLAIN